MTTTTYTRDLDRLMTLDEAVANARQDAIDAWHIQAVTTQEEGYTQEQANAAIEQAKLADQHYRHLYNLREARYVNFLTLQDEERETAEDTEAEIDITPLGGW